MDRLSAWHWAQCGHYCCHFRRPVQVYLQAGTTREVWTRRVTMAENGFGCRMTWIRTTQRAA